MTDIVTMPDSLYRLAQLRFNPAFINTVAGGSSFNPFAKVVGPSSAYWMADLTFNQMSGDNLLDLRAFIMSLQGGKVLARLYDRSRTQTVGGSILPLLRGAGGASYVVNAAANALAGATSITIKNLTPSEAVALGAFDEFGIGENLYAVQASCGSDSSGQATISFQPPLRLGVATDDPINLSKPTGRFRLTAGSTDPTFVSPVMSENFTLSFIEEPDVG